MRAEMLALMEGVMADMLKHHPDRPMMDASLFIVEPPLPVVFDKKAIKAALDILKPKLAEREDCLEDIRCSEAEHTTKKPCRSLLKKIILWI